MLEDSIRYQYMLEKQNYSMARNEDERHDALRRMARLIYVAEMSVGPELVHELQERRSA